MKRTWLLLIVLYLSLPLLSQERMVIDDRTGILAGELEEQIAARLAAEGISYTNVVDFKERCLYFFTEFRLQDEDLLVSVKNCDDEVLGRKNLGTRIRSAQVQEQVSVITYALLDITSEPGKYKLPSPSAETQAVQQPGTSDEMPLELPENEHDSRYFFAPSAYNLKKGELYYNTVYFLLHDIQFGLSDNFSAGIGTTIIGLPMYLTPKISFPLGERSALAVGDMLLFGTWGTNGVGNLLYTNYSYGGSEGNISVGAGYLVTNENDITGQTSSMVGNFSAMARLSPYIFLLTENYLLSMNLNRDAWYEQYNPALGYYDYVEAEYQQRNTLWYGIIGIRIITKKTDFTSWQIGLTYVVNFPGEIPRQYASWETYANTGMNLIAFPAISYSRKFGRRF